MACLVLRIMTHLLVLVPVKHSSPAKAGDKIIASKSLSFISRLNSNHRPVQIPNLQKRSSHTAAAHKTRPPHQPPKPNQPPQHNTSISLPSKMRKLIYSAAPSLDGFIASPPPSHDTSWIVPTPSIDFRALYARFDAFVMGRRTFEAVTADPAYDFLRVRMADGNVEVVVVSRSMGLDEIPGVKVVREAKDALEWIRDMKPRDGKRIWMMGGGWLAGECLRAGLLDAVEMAVMPVVLGRGVKMIEFPDGEEERWYKLGLREVERLENGVLMLVYDVVYGENTGSS